MLTYGRRLARSNTFKALAFALPALTLLAPSRVLPAAALRFKCPALQVACPAEILEGSPLAFTATLTPAVPSPTYAWTVSADEIISGQNESSLTVNTHGLAEQRVRGTVVADNLGADCPKQTKSCTTKITARALNYKPTIGSFSASTSTITLPADCPEGQKPDPACKPSSSATVQISTIATDPDGDTMFYTYSTTGGRVTGSGPNATFDLTGVAPGTYTVTVEVDDGSKEPDSVATASTTINVERCGCVERKPRP